MKRATFFYIISISCFTFIAVFFLNQFWFTFSHYTDIQAAPVQLPGQCPLRIMRKRFISMHQLLNESNLLLQIY